VGGLRGDGNFLQGGGEVERSDWEMGNGKWEGFSETR